MTVLTINAGSSSIKFALFENAAAAPRASGQVECIGSAAISGVLKSSGEKLSFPIDGDDHQASIQAILAVLKSELSAEPDLIGHRVVHGGSRFREPLALTPETIASLAELNSLAPLHNPANLAGIQACAKVYPDCPQFAVFDTAFHATIPEVNFRYAIPEEWYQEHQIRRYGFHGISHGFIAGEAIQHFQLEPDDHRILIAHLGNGCSVSAVRDGKSIDTSMGFTPLEGLVMGTRSGSIDPGIHAHIAKAAGLSLDEVTASLNKKSGLLGVCGKSDMRELQAAIDAGDSQAQLALDIFTHRLVKELSALIGSLEGAPDALIFTGGIGENNASLRAEVAKALGWIGFEIDPTANQAANEGPRRISSDSSRLLAVIPTNEELAIARACQAAHS